MWASAFSSVPFHLSLEYFRGELRREEPSRLASLCTLTPRPRGWFGTGSRDHLRQSPNGLEDVQTAPRLPSLYGVSCRAPGIHLSDGQSSLRI